MPDWFVAAFHISAETAVRLVIAGILGAGVSAIYWLTQRGQKTFSPGFLTTLMLLSILIAAVTQVIGDNTARAFSLVGALAIIRFRTIVEDTRDTAYVICAVVVGMAAGAGFFSIALLSMGLVTVASLALRPLSASGREPGLDMLLSMRLGLGASPEVLLRESFARYLAAHQFRSSATARQGAALEVTYAVALRDDLEATALVRALNSLEGVQNVELRKI